MKVAEMKMQAETTSIINLVMNCKYCHPLSGCIVSDLKGKKKSEIRAHLRGLNEAAFDRIRSYHESCPYRSRLAI